MSCLKCKQNTPKTAQTNMEITEYLPQILDITNAYFEKTGKFPKTYLLEEYNKEGDKHTWRYALFTDQKGKQIEKLKLGLVR